MTCAGGGTSAAEAVGAATEVTAGSADGAIPTPSPAQSLIGRMVGEYKVTGVIGEGGMGTVYAAVQPLIGKRVAIKVLKASTRHDRADERRFLAEAQAVNRIGHPNIVDVFSFGTFSDGAQYFVMEHLSGRSLGSYLKDHKPVPYREAHDILSQVFDALTAAHAQGIVHRDLKPDNIFLCERTGGFTVKLLDFGLAKFTDDDVRTARTRTGVPLGTPLYMAPEQCYGKEVDKQSDIYALGVILYEMFTGTVPFGGSTSFEVMMARLAEDPTPPGRIAQIPDALDAIILACLARNKAERPATVDEVAGSLLPLLAQLAAADGPPAPVPIPGARPVTISPHLLTGPHRRRRRTVLLGLIAAAVCAVVVVLVLRFGRPGAPPAPAPAVVTPPPARDAGGARMVTLQFMVEPPVPGQEIWVDGKKLDRPQLETPRSKEHALEVKVVAPGYEPYVAHPVPVSDLVVPVRLVKHEEPPTPPASPRIGRAPRHKPANAKTPAPPTKTPRVLSVDKL